MHMERVWGMDMETHSTVFLSGRVRSSLRVPSAEICRRLTDRFEPVHSGGSGMKDFGKDSLRGVVWFMMELLPSFVVLSSSRLSGEVLRDGYGRPVQWSGSAFGVD